MPAPHILHDPNICGVRWVTETTNQRHPDAPRETREHTCTIKKAAPKEEHKNHRCYCYRETVNRDVQEEGSQQ